MIQPEKNSKNLLGITRAKAKMYEYDVSIEDHIDISTTPLGNLIDLTIGMLGDLTASHASINLNEEKYKLIFSARYFDSLVETNTITEGVDYLKLLASSSYYLAGYPGSSKVLIRTTKVDKVTEYSLIAKVLFLILSRSKILTDDFQEYEFVGELKLFIAGWNDFLNEGSESSALNAINSLRNKIYADGNDRDLLLVDVIRASVFKIINSSAWKLLPLYSNLDFETWRPYLSQSSSIKELWPSQILLGEKGILRGASSVIQMPTSAGKTKAAEIIIRSSFLSGRSSLAVIIAPFRALCQEIYNDLSTQFIFDLDVSINIVSDVLQNDLTEIPEDKKGVFILTPEKFDFILRHDKEMAQKIGLIVYDEGHLFDDIKRGLKYELLLASLKSQLASNTQVLLISAVMSNAEQIKEWLLGDMGVLTEGKNLSPTNRNIAFSSWGRDLRGRLNFVDEENTGQTLFFVPRVLESQNLELRPQERTRRTFPAKNIDGSYKSNHIAIYLGCKLSNQGLTAVFAGRKDSAITIAKDLLDAYSRGLILERPLNFSEYQTQAEKLIRYIERVLGVDSTQAKAARLGILIHHGSTPHGLRLSIEFALQKLHFRSVICTSTLAQGVNLPVRYLIISTSRQGEEFIKVRDFHNLMGRAGRSGFYTEGTVIFSDPSIYDKRLIDSWQWNKAKSLIDPRNSEACQSVLLSIFLPEPEEEEKKKSWQYQQGHIKETVNSYLLSALEDVVDISDLEINVRRLVKNTLAYFQVNDEQKAKLIDFFLQIGMSILVDEPNVEKRKIFTRSVLSLNSSQQLLGFLNQNSFLLEAVTNELDMLTYIWEALYEHVDSKIIKSFSSVDSLGLCKKWIEGASFYSLYEYAKDLEYASTRNLNLDQIVDLCETGFAYNLSLVISSMAEVYELADSEEIDKKRVKAILYKLQKSMKYGLPFGLPTFIYETGLSDRELSQEIVGRLAIEEGEYTITDIIQKIDENNSLKDYILNNYPDYFSEKLRQLISNYSIPF